MHIHSFIPSLSIYHSTHFIIGGSKVNKVFSLLEKLRVCKEERNVNRQLQICVINITKCHGHTNPGGSLEIFLRGSQLVEQKR